MKILLVSGSRSIKNLDLVKKVIDSFMLEHGKGITHLLTGGAIGIDVLSERVFLDNYRNVFVVPSLIPDYKKYGWEAPIIRNQDLVDKADILLAIWDGVSSGTTDTINKARKKGIPCYVVNVND